MVIPILLPTKSESGIRPLADVTCRLLPLISFGIYYTFMIHIKTCSYVYTCICCSYMYMNICVLIYVCWFVQAYFCLFWRMWMLQDFSPACWLRIREMQQPMVYWRSNWMINVTYWTTLWRAVVTVLVSVSREENKDIDIMSNLSNGDICDECVELLCCSVFFTFIG